ncbi:MAG TPA: hypothetical protein VEA61_13720 [Allosphingosinicella sp.]|nr:hypothetical protein [Allosphingosinicella sp.]
MKFDERRHAKNIRLTRQFLAMAEEAAASALQRGGGRPPTRLHEPGGAVRHQLELALYRWGSGEDPAAYLEGVVAAAQRADEVARGHPHWPHLDQVDFALARFATFLLGRKDRIAERVGPLDAPDRLLDYALFETLHDQRARNGHVVDFRLVAVLDKVGYEGSSIRNYPDRGRPAAIRSAL